MVARVGFGENFGRIYRRERFPNSSARRHFSKVEKETFAVFFLKNLQKFFYVPEFVFAEYSIKMEMKTKRKRGAGKLQLGGRFVSFVNGFLLKTFFHELRYDKIIYKIFFPRFSCSSSLVFIIFFQFFSVLLIFFCCFSIHPIFFCFFEF